MATEHNNAGAHIIAEAIIESAQVYADLLRDATDEIEKIFKDLATVQKVPVQEKPQVSPEKAPSSTTYKSLLEEIQALSKEQQQTKKERDISDFKGTRKYATESDAQRAFALNSVKLRALYAALAISRGMSLNTIESNWRKTSPHPAYIHIGLINEYLQKYGFAKTKVPADKPVSNTVQTSKPVTYGVRIDGNISQSKLAIVKLLKETSGLGLKETKDMVDRAPVLVESGLDKATADKWVAALVARGYNASVIQA